MTFDPGPSDLVRALVVRLYLDACGKAMVTREEKEALRGHAEDGHDKP